MKTNNNTNTVKTTRTVTRRVLALLLAALSLMSTLLVSANAVEEEAEPFELLFSELTDWDDELTGYTVSGFTGTVPAELVIPDTHADMPVCVIDEKAFKGCGTLVSVTIPESVYYIDDNAFNGCSALETVSFSEATVCAYAFFNCKKLTVVNGELVYIEHDAFSGCENLREVTVSGWNYVGENAFFNCTDLETVHVNGYGSYLMYDINETGNAAYLDADWDYVHYAGDYDCEDAQITLEVSEETIVTPEDVFGEYTPDYAACRWECSCYGEATDWYGYDDQPENELYLEGRLPGTDVYRCDLLDENGDVIFEGYLDVNVEYTLCQQVQNLFSNSLIGRLFRILRSIFASLFTL